MNSAQFGRGAYSASRPLLFVPGKLLRHPLHWYEKSIKPVGMDYANHEQGID
jgi:hypothetical protein